MKTWKWLPVVTATLLAGAVFAQSGVASAIGCIYTENFNGGLLIRNCVDGSGGGAAKFLSIDPVTFFKKYRLQANLKLNSAPNNLAKTELFTAAGQPASLSVKDTNFADGQAVTSDLQVPSFTNLTLFKFSSGDNSGT